MLIVDGFPIVLLNDLVDVLAFELQVSFFPPKSFFLGCDLCCKQFAQSVESVPCGGLFQPTAHEHCN